MDRTNPGAFKMIPGTQWRHSLTGCFYQVVGVARFAADNSPMILFRAVGAPLDAEPWVTPERKWRQLVRTENGDRVPRYIRA
jgi:hypothetical protein